MFLSEWRKFPSASCLAKKKKTLMTACVSMLLKSRESLTCFRACFLPGRAKDLSAPRVYLRGHHKSNIDLPAAVFNDLAELRKRAKCGFDLIRKKAGIF